MLFAKPRVLSRRDFHATRAVLALAVAGCAGDPSLLTRDLDDDRDSAPVSVDCDDHDVEVNPRQPEQCDGKDNDCDGLVDGDDKVDIPLHWYADDDDDGWGAGEDVAVGCEGPAGTVPQTGDCNDDDPEINPEAKDICENGIDEDCTGGDATC